MIEVWFDGSCMPTNPGGVMGWGWCVEGPGWRASDAGNRQAAPGNTNNLAEYLALEAALIYLESGEWVPREKNTRADALSKGGKA